MPYVPVPKDLTHVRQKVLFNLTRRQLVCFLGGALVGAPLFYLLKPYVASSAASLVMVLVMIPFILLGVYEKNAEHRCLLKPNDSRSDAKLLPGGRSKP